MVGVTSMLNFYVLVAMLALLIVLGLLLVIAYNAYKQAHMTVTIYLDVNELFKSLMAYGIMLMFIWGMFYYLG